ncbi:protein FAM71C-like [Molossus molossus]|uniref:protein FAM71C-like n=1 Tax=Molossus molossus TaxID=27622 RepID=UPI00174665B2|nr:protein FAM71C-like [Molossus molossus]
MNSSTKLWQGSAQGSHVLPMFRGSMGTLQQQLCTGEFAMFKHILMFESDFIQINKRGEMIDMHNSVRIVTVGVAYTSPNLTIPDVLLLARPALSCAVCTKHERHTRGTGLKSAKTLELTRLLPLKFVRLSIYSHEKKQLQLKLASGHSFYLQLCPPPNAKEDVFAHWEDLVLFLRPPVEAYSGTQAVPACDMMDIPVLEAEDRNSPAAMELHEGVQDQVSIRSLHVVTEVSGITSLAYTGGEGIQQDASQNYPVLKDTPSFLTLAPLGPDQGTVPGTAAVTPQGSVGAVAGEEMTSRPVTETVEGPGTEPLLSASQSKDNMSKQDGGQTVPQSQAKAPRKRKEKEKTSTIRPSQFGKKGEDKSPLKSRGTTKRAQKEKYQSSPEGQECGSSPQEYNSLGVTQKGTRSQKLRRS